MKSEIIQIPLTQLVHFKNHPFKIYNENRLKDLAESIRINGVLTPIIVRESTKDDRYEILSGHNRVEASLLIGHTDISAIVREDLKYNDEEALLIVTLTNLQQRGFAELTHSERAKVIKLTYESLKQQGKRNDLIIEVESLLGGKELLSNIRKKLTPREIVAEQFSLNTGTIGLYLRLEKLTQELLERLDDGEFELSVAEKLTYLPFESQKVVADVSNTNKLKLTIGKAKMLVNESKNNSLNKTKVEEILSRRQIRKSNHRLTLDVIEQYFSDKSPNEIDEMLNEALAAYINKK